MATIVHPSMTTRRRGFDAGAMQRVLRTDAAPAPVLLRVTLAAILFPHGAQHLLGWFGGYGFTGTHQWMTGTLGIPAALATLAILTEFFAPIALLVGLGGRLAALGIVGVMVGAASTHVANGLFMNWYGTLPAGVEGFEFHLLVIAMALAIVLQGSGAWSVDRLLGFRGKMRTPNQANPDTLDPRPH